MCVRVYVIFISIEHDRANRLTNEKASVAVGKNKDDGRKPKFEESKGKAQSLAYPTQL